MYHEIPPGKYLIPALFVRVKCQSSNPDRNAWLHVTLVELGNSRDSSFLASIRLFDIGVNRVYEKYDLKRIIWQAAYDNHIQLNYLSSPKEVTELNCS